MTRPLTGDKFEIAVLNAELRGFSELIDTWKEEAERCARAIERVRELHKPIKNNEVLAWWNNQFKADDLLCVECMQNSYREYPTNYPCPTIKALDGDE